MMTNHGPISYLKSFSEKDLRKGVERSRVYHKYMIYSTHMDTSNLVIVGAGFAGIRAALDLDRAGISPITLISASEYFEYYPGLHKLVGISHHAVVRIPLATIFAGTRVSLVYEKATHIDLAEKTVTTPSQVFRAQQLILALGSQTEYFGISGLKELAYPFKSQEEALRLKKHIIDMFEKYAHADKAESVVGLHMVVVGAGPNGVDLAGELATLTRALSKKYQVTESLVTLDLVEGAPRVLPMMPEKVSQRVEQRLHKLGVNVFCNRDLRKQESWTVSLADMTIGARTLIWTAGITSNELVKSIAGVTLGKKNRIAVDEYLGIPGFPGCFAIGDIADTSFAGLAQTALYDGEYIARHLVEERDHASSSQLKKYVPHPVAFNIGVGHRWSVLVIGSWISFGIFPYIMRTLIDIKFFLSILSWRQVWSLYTSKEE